MIVSHRERSVDVWTRGVDGAFSMTTVRDDEVAELGSIGAQLDVRERYDATAERRAYRAVEVDSPRA